MQVHLLGMRLLCSVHARGACHPRTLSAAPGLETALQQETRQKEQEKRDKEQQKRDKEQQRGVQEGRLEEAIRVQRKREEQLVAASDPDTRASLRIIVAARHAYTDKLGAGIAAINADIAVTNADLTRINSRIDAIETMLDAAQGVRPPPLVSQGACKA